MSASTQMIYAAAEREQSAQARIVELEAALHEIVEYWNRDQNEQAMADACWHAIDTASAALEKTK